MVSIEVSAYPRDYKPVRATGALPVARRRFPLFRLLLLIVLGYFLFHNREKITTQYHQIVKEIRNLTLTSESPTVVSITKPQRQVFHLKNGWFQESWRIKTDSDLEWLCHHTMGQERCQVTRALASDSLGRFSVGVVDLISKDTLSPLVMAYWKGRQSSQRLVKIGNESLSYWIDMNRRCVWMEPCPAHPLEGGEVPIGKDFDFLGREHLYTQDLFVGIGESPIVAILSGHIRRIDTLASGYALTLYHGGDLQTKSTGLRFLADDIGLGHFVQRGQVLGRLSARDTAQFTLQILRNGRFVRWSDFRSESYPVADSAISTFLESTGL